MYIQNLKIRNFRIIKSLDLELSKNINIFIGNNAQGKTSILESVYMLALTKSLRNVEEIDLINRNTDFLKIKGLIKSERLNRKLELILTKNSKILKISEKEVKRTSDYISSLNVIMFNPDDLDIIKKSPQVRRGLLNIELCQLFPNYMKLLNEYNKILKMRNDYLKKPISKIDKDYFKILTDKLIDRSLVIEEYREKFVENINKYIGDTFSKITKTRGLVVKYEKSLELKEKRERQSFYHDNFINELNRKMTLFGPHRDDISFYLGDEDLKIFGSQGQQRIAILSFKLSEINLFKEVKGYYPVVLLDDIFSEIDIEKRNRLLKFIKSNIQFVITTTDIKNISEKILTKAKIFHMKNGIVKMGENKWQK